MYRHIPLSDIEVNGMIRNSPASVFISAFFAVMIPVSVCGQDFSLKTTPLLSIPVGESGTLYSIGGALDASIELELFGFLSPSVEVGFGALPARNVGKNFVVARGGAGLGAFFYPTPRLKLTAGASGGAYSATYDKSQTGMYWKAGGAAGYRFSPTFTLLGSAGFDRYLWMTGPVYSGLTFGVTANLALGSLGAGSGGIQVDNAQEDQVFPIRYRAYMTTPVSVLELTNREQAEIRNVTVTFSAGAYSAEPMACAKFPVIARGKTVKVPLYAALDEKILTLTENSKIQCDVVVSYELLDAPREVHKSETIAFTHRNALRWTDDRMVASFVSPNDPAVLDFSKFVAGLVRDKIRPEVDKNLQYGLGVFESLRLAGLVGTPDPSTPYATYHRDPALVDYIQYPYQTLGYKSGDSDDLAVLYAAMLASVGVPSAYAVLGDEMIAAIPLAVKPGALDSSFTNKGDLIVADGAVWLPVRVSLVREGFLRAWVSGAELWRKAVASGQAPKLVILDEAWRSFPAVGIAAEDTKTPKPRDAQVILAFDNAVALFIGREIGPKIDAMRAQMGPQGSARQLNNLGVMYAKYGYYDEAMSEFGKAEKLGNASAVTNLANIAFMKKDWTTAEKWFRKALELQTDNKAALIGLARTLYELDEYAEADAYFLKVREKDPALADRYSYLSSSVDSSASRASAAAADRSGTMAWDDGE
ncbi:MAG: hypothetical protein NT080_00610 [Spirochaetes bacterium]|nr:hypothetical protein [Spirochaetota bacterium]